MVKYQFYFDGGYQRGNFINMCGKRIAKGGVQATQ